MLPALLLILQLLTSSQPDGPLTYTLYRLYILDALMLDTEREAHMEDGYVREFPRWLSEFYFYVVLSPV